ncbi:MAG: hypothetical protein WCK02_01625 [Bacteroidota bacterium]
MKKRKFEVPKPAIGTFFSNIEEMDLDYELLSVLEDDAIEVEVSYKDKNRDEVMTLIEIIDDYEDSDE